MSSAAPGISHDYDPQLVFRSHAANIPLLNSWVDELLTLTENAGLESQAPTTDQLVQSLKRYDAIVRELLRQTSIFSQPITRMLGKTWSGVVKLLDYMIKSYHRYVKRRNQLQEQAEELIKERGSLHASIKIREEEFEL